MKTEYHLFNDSNELFKNTRDTLLNEAKKAITLTGSFQIALSGGNTPKKLYQLISRLGKDFPWKQTTFFISDERMVPYDHDHSNYKMIKETLFADMNENEYHFIPIPTSQSDLPQLSTQFEKDIVNHFKTVNKIKNGLPSFDLILLGMGDDGHTASLFPDNTESLNEQKKIILEVYAPKGKPPGYRITFTYPLLNNSSKILFLITGSNKKKILQKMLVNNQKAWDQYPAARIKALDTVAFYLDHEAIYS